MPPHTYKFEYAVIGPDGNLGKMYPLESRYGNETGIMNLVAEDYHKRPESEGAEWPLTFMAFSTAGRQIGPYTVKRWFLPCFLVTSGQAKHHSTPFWERQQGSAYKG